MITITLNQIVDGSKVINEISNKTVKGKVAFQLARIMREIEKEYSLFQKNRQILIEKYGKRNEAGFLQKDENGNFSIEQDKIEAFNAEVKELLETNLELNVEKIDFEDLEDTDFTPQQMFVLIPFIEE